VVSLTLLTFATPSEFGYLSLLFSGDFDLFRRRANNAPAVARRNKPNISGSGTSAGCCGLVAESNWPAVEESVKLLLPGNGLQPELELPVPGS
jgi:hypothetical protein